MSDVGPGRSGTPGSAGGPLPGACFEHSLERLAAEARALQWLAGGPHTRIHDLASLLEADPAEIERTWRLEEPLSIPARERLAHLLDQFREEVERLRAQLRRPLLTAVPGGRRTTRGPNGARSRSEPLRFPTLRLVTREREDEA